MLEVSLNLETFVLIILFIHQTLDLVGVKGYVSRPEFKSPDTFGWLIYLVMLTLYFFNIPFVNVAFIVIFGLVIYGLYFFHWKLYFFGASEKKIKGYNEYFRGTHRTIPESKNKVVPDTFHIVHSCLYLIAFITLVKNFIIEIGLVK